MVTKNLLAVEQIDTTHKYTHTTTAAAATALITSASHKNDEKQQQSAEVKSEESLETNSSTEKKEHYLPKASEPPQVIIIPATQASTVATNAAKKIRRAFSMPRNPFRWSRKFKTTATINSTDVGGGEPNGSVGSTGNTHAGGVGREVRNSTIISSCVGRKNAGSTLSLNGGYQAVGGKQENNANEVNEKEETTLNLLPNDKEIPKNCDSKNIQQISKNNNNNKNVEGSGNRVIRRSSLRKFLNRIAQHVSSSVNVGSNGAAPQCTTTTTANNNPTKTGLIDIVPFYMGCWRKKRANKNVTGYQTSNQNGKIDRMRNTLERVPPITNGVGGGGYQWPPDQIPGVMGLKNHGNTCFMNAVLQCLSHTDILAEYFVLDQYKVDLKRRNKINSRKFGTKGELTEQLANVLKALWTCKNESDHSTSFKAVVDRYGSQFRSSTQHDAQEFLFWLLDKVHEDLNTATKRRYKNVKNNYGRPDDIIAAETLANHIRCNNSFVQAVFQAQFRSSLTCPRCKKQSNTFDPFHCISVQLPQLTQQSVFVTVVYMKQVPRQVKMGITVPAGSPIVALRERLQLDTGIASERMVIVDINNEGFARVYYDTQPVSTLQDLESIYCIEVPELIAQKTNSTIINNTTTINSNKSDNDNGKTKTTTTTATSITNNGNGESSNIPPNGELLLLVACVRKKVIKYGENGEKEIVNVNEIKSANEKEVEDEEEDSQNIERFGVPFSLLLPRDCTYVELQKKLLREMSLWLRPEVFTYSTPPAKMFQIRLQDPSADPDTYLENVEHPLLTEMIDLALSVLSAEAGPPHIKLLLEWCEPHQYFVDIEQMPSVIEHESATRLKAQKTSDTVALTLEQCLEHYTKAETLSAEDAWRCPHCQQYLPVVKTLGLWSLPDILVIHFKRFRQHHEKGANAAKLTTMVKFPLNAFDMSPHLAREAMEMNANNYSHSNNTLQVAAAALAAGHGPWLKSKSQKGDSRSSTLNSRDNRETHYDLYAVCYHQGDTLETGHYTAACKNPYDRQWYKFDDQRVSKVPDDNIMEEIINNEAYMLFYQRRNPENSECSGSSSSSGDHWISRIAPPPPPPASLISVGDEQKIEKLELKSSEEDDIKLSEEAEKSSALSVAMATPVDNKIEENDMQGTVSTQKMPIVEAKLTEQVVGIKLENMLAELDFVDADLSGSNEGIAAKITNVGRDKKEEEKVREDIAHNIFVMDEDVSHENMKNITANNINTTINTSINTTSPMTSITTTANSTKTTITTKNIENFTTLNGTMETQKNHMLNGHDKVTPSTSPTKHAIKRTSAITAINRKLNSINSPKIDNYDNNRNSNHSINNGKKASDENVDNNTDDDVTADDDGIIKTTSVLLSSSLQSNSGSSYIGAALGSYSSEFRLARQQQLQWNGSRTSVSSAIEHNNQQPHGLSLRHSFSTSSNYKLRECNETLSSMLRNSANTCSKDTLIFLDQQNHHHHHHSHHLHHHHHNHNHHSLIEDDDDTFMDNRSLWISPVTPHKLITVSPKN